MEKDERVVEMRRKTYVILTIFYASLIFVLSSFPKVPTIERPFLDKLEHVIEYSVLGFLAVSCFKKIDRKTIILAILITSLYGVLDEFHQYFVPGRDFSIFDILADSVGGLLGVRIRSGARKIS